MVNYSKTRHNTIFCNLTESLAVVKKHKNKESLADFI